MAEFDRDALIESMCRIHVDTFEGATHWDKWAEWAKEGKPEDEEHRFVLEILSDERKAAGLALPGIVAATLAPIEALHVRVAESFTASSTSPDVTFRYHCRHCGTFYHWPCPTAQAIADIKAKAGVPCPD